MTVVFSVIFPSNLSYFPSFLISLENQTNNNFKLFLINDGVLELERYLKNTSLEYETHFVNNLTAFEIRLFGLKLVSKLKPDVIIFADTDDIFSVNRVEILVEKLEKHPFVCNDINLINELGETIEKTVWEKRVGDNFQFDIQYVKNKNLIGLGNAGMQFRQLKGILNKLNQISDGNDWLFFSAAESELNVLFVTSCSTHYRQHDNNLIGKKKLDIESIKKVIQGKIKHYELLQTIGFKVFDVKQEIKHNKILLQLTNNEPQNVRNQLLNINSLNTNFFWWEEPNYLKL